MTTKINHIQIQEFEKDNRINQFFEKNWGNNFIVSNGKIFYGNELPGYMALKENEIIGLLTYHIENNSCEIVSLNSLHPDEGIGSKLIEKIINKAKSKKFSRLWLITSNDNMGAMKFYQKRGFVFKAIHPNAIEKSRLMGQNIPILGSDDIPVLDEIEFEYQFEK